MYQFIRKLRICFVLVLIHCERSSQLQKLNPLNFKCQLDSKINPSTISDYKDDIGSMFGDACGRNRGIFVTMPGDGHTYNCGKFPNDWNCPDASTLLQPTTNPEVSMAALSNYLAANYNTSIVKTADSCNFGSLSQIICGRELPWKTAPWHNKLHAPIRSVNIGGLFVLERWILPSFTNWGSDSGIIDQYTFSQKCSSLGICSDLVDHWNSFYSSSDFFDMRQMGLNTIRLPIGYWYFAASVGVDPSPYLVPTQDVMVDKFHPITRIIEFAQNAGLAVIIDLHGAPGSQNGLDNSGQADTVDNYQNWGSDWLYDEDNLINTIKILVQISRYCGLYPDTIIALELLNEPWSMLDIGSIYDFYIDSIHAVRLVNPNLPIIIHDAFRATSWSQLLMKFNEDNVFMDVHVYHGFNPADIASDTETDDKVKMTTHEAMSCGYGSYLKFVTCDALPVFVGEWSLAIDDCMPDINPRWMDFGQCNYIRNGASRLNDTWWFDHIQDFAERQISVFEQLLGWSFWTYKLDSYAESPLTNYAPDGVPLWSFKTAVRLGLINTTNWHLYDSNDKMLFEDACNHRASLTSTGESDEIASQQEYSEISSAMVLILICSLFLILYSSIHLYPSIKNRFRRRRHVELPSLDPINPSRSSSSSSSYQSQPYSLINTQNTSILN